MNYLKLSKEEGNGGESVDRIEIVDDSSDSTPVNAMASISQESLVSEVEMIENVTELSSESSCDDVIDTLPMHRQSWKKVFPQNLIDNTALNDDEDIVTLHATGDIIVKPPQPEILDRILAQYLVDPPKRNTSQEQESCEPQEELMSDSAPSSAFYTPRNSCHDAVNVSAASGYKGGSEATESEVTASAAVVVASAIREAHHEAHVSVVARRYYSQIAEAEVDVVVCRWRRPVSCSTTSTSSSEF